MNFSIVTVAHATDLPLLKLQARSLNHYLARDFVREIIVVDNSTGTSINRAELLSQYKLPVRIIDAKDIAPVQHANGWLTQQVHKLLIARHVRTKNYILLDAKNHLVAPVSRATFQHADGRLRTGMYGYRHHPLQQRILRSCRFFGVDPAKVLHLFLPTITPFSMPTVVVRRLLREVERSGPFAQTFLAAGVTEFSMLGTYVLSTGHKLEDYYVNDAWFTANLWKWQNNRQMQHEITDLTRDFFSVHRRTFSKMDATTQQMLAVLWHQRKLFASFSDAIRFVRGCAMTYR